MHREKYGWSALLRAVLSVPPAPHVGDFRGRLYGRIPTMIKPALRTTLILALLTAVALSSISSREAGAVLSPGDNQRSLMHDSELREFNVYAHSEYDGLSPTPLIVDLHGAGSDRVQQQGISGWSQKANEVGLLVVYPDGLGQTWNAGVCCGSAMTNNEDDVGFILAMLTAIQAEANVDANQIYVTGISNGGAMTQRLVCEAANIFAAAAPMAFPTPYADFATECTPSREIPVLSFMGLTDIVVPYENGTFGGAIESLESWRAKNTCGPEPMEVHFDFGQSFCDLDTSCAGGTQVGLCSVLGSDLPPPLDVFNGHLVYLNEDDFVLADTAWEFFSTGNITEPPPSVPFGGAAMLVALVAGLVGAGALTIQRHNSR
jgi:polyhydroxybutyrate depolymerase